VAEEEFDCEAFMEGLPGKGLKGVVEGFTVALETMKEPFEIALSVMLGMGQVPPWAIKNAGLAAKGFPKIALMPVSLFFEMKTKIDDAELPAFGLGPVNMGPFNAGLEAPLLSAALGEMVFGLVMIPLKGLKAVVSLSISPGDFGPKMIIDFGPPPKGLLVDPGLPNLDAGAALNLGHCLEAVITANLPIKAYEPSGAEKAAAKKVNDKEYNLGYEDAKKGNSPKLTRPEMVPEELVPAEFDDEGNPILDSDGRPKMKPMLIPPNFYKYGYYRGWRTKTKKQLGPDDTTTDSGFETKWNNHFSSRKKIKNTAPEGEPSNEVPHWNMKDPDTKYTGTKYPQEKGF
jgi:hypothetical protein